MNARPRIGIILAVAAATITAFTFQQAEIARLRAIISEPVALQNLHPEIAAKWSTLEAEVESLRIEADQLRAENLRMRSDKEEALRLKERVRVLAAELDRIRSMRELAPPHSSVETEEILRSKVSAKAAALADTNPLEAARWVSSLQPGSEQDAAAIAVVRAWVDKDPHAAAEWVQGFPEGQLRKEALGEIARKWGLSDWNGTASWLETLPKGDSKDAAINNFVWSADGYDIRLASEWANRIEASQLRSERVEGTLRRWLSEDNTAARGWIQNAQLPPGMKEKLLSQEKPPEPSL